MKSLKRALPVFSKAVDRRTALLTGAAAVGAAACGPMVAVPDAAIDAAATDTATMDAAVAPDVMTEDTAMIAVDATPDVLAREAAVEAGSDAAADVASGPACPASAVAVGPRTMFASGSRTYFASGQFFVARDGGGFYALTAVCTHSGCIVLATDGTGFACPCHGSNFDANGAVTAGPAGGPLVHYAMCQLSDGRLAVDRMTVVPAATRLPA